ncbi:MAG: N-acetylmuramoyl-L-alanine amidase [Clostridium sp.]|nr:N-acetylmuramoyl-L-alanine amidase [Clostridium sp.]
MQINKLLTPYNLNRLGDTSRIKYIVIHYVGATGGAEANCRYYASKYIGASAHYYVGFNGEIWQSVEDGDIAWHCGAKSYRHPECRNSNSIGMELCVRNKGSQAADSRDWYFEEATVTAAIELTRELMEKYGVPAERVIRHYDVTGKICPNPYVYNHTAHTWEAFKAALTATAPKEYPQGFIQAADGIRWWYQFKDGSYARNGWYWLTEATGGTSGWYLFDDAGYMLTGYQTDPAGERFFLCPDKGIHEGQCMVTDERGVLRIVGEYDFEEHKYVRR